MPLFVITRCYMNLPTPALLAQQASAALTRLILDEIDQAGGWIPFSRYMALALFAPGLGYYSGGARKFGTDGDFVTAPEITPLFGHTLARQLAPLMAQSAPHVMEVGAGTGALAADLLLSLEALGSLPARYDILELSAELAERQRETLAARAGHLLDRVHWLTALPTHFSGVVVGNEVLDAMPADSVCWREEGVFCRGVVREGEGFAWAERPAHGALLAGAESLAPGLPLPYTSEIHLASGAWVRSIGAMLSTGAVVLIDYGFPAAEFYHPERSQGTLMCHYRHQAHGDPFQWPGLTDITTHVDFTAIAQAAVDAGLEVLGYTSQASFLMNCGVLSVMEAQPMADAKARAQQSHAVNMLLSPAEMGELFKVIALGRGVDPDLIGFARGDRVHRL